MRSLLTLCISIALCASAEAAPRKPHAQSRPVIMRPGAAVSPGYVSPSGGRVYRDDSAPGGFRTDHDDPPSPNDPSRFGGG
jgi:hypothetical protein